MTTPSAYRVGQEPEALLNKHNKAPVYDGIRLFCETLEQVTNQPAEIIQDIGAMGFNHPYSVGGEGLKVAQLDEMVDNLIAGPETSTEYQLSMAQVNYLYNTRFKKEDEM